MLGLPDADARRCKSLLAKADKPLGIAPLLKPRGLQKEKFRPLTGICPPFLAGLLGVGQSFAAPKLWLQILVLMGAAGQSLALAGPTLQGSQEDLKKKEKKDLGGIRGTQQLSHPSCQSPELS